LPKRARLARLLPRCFNESHAGVEIMKLVAGVALAVGLAAPPAAQAAAVPLRVPFDFSRHVIGLDVTVKGHQLFMMLDTGVNPSTIDLARAEALGMPLDRKAAGVGNGEGGGRAEAIPSSIKALAIGGRGFGDIEALAVDMRAVSSAYGRKVDGALGYSFLKGKVVLIDYPAKAVSFFSSGAEAAAPTAMCRRHYTTAFVSLGDEEFPLMRDFHIGAIKGPATLDTGSSRLVGIYRGALNVPGLVQTLKVAGQEKGASFGGGYTTGNATLTVPVGIGPFELPAGQAVSIMPDEGSMQTRIANVGNQFLASMNGKLLLDYAGQRISMFADCGK
jgi:hypothetical protein